MRRRRAHDVSHRKVAATTHGPSRAWGIALAAAPRRDASGVRIAGTRRDDASPSVPGLLRAQRHGDGVLDAQGRGTRLRALADPRAACAVQESDAGAVGHQRELELHPRRRVGIVPDRHDARRTERSGDPRRRLDGPVAGAPLRERDAGRVARARDGRARQRGRLHRHPELRLHAHDLVAQRRRSHCRWSTTRAPCSRRLFGDSGSTGRAAREARLRQQKSLLDSVNAKLANLRAGARRAGSGEGRAVHRSRSRHRAPNSEEPSSSATSSYRRWSNRRVCRRCSRITWR